MSSGYLSTQRWINPRVPFARRRGMHSHVNFGEPGCHDLCHPFWMSPSQLGKARPKQSGDNLGSTRRDERHPSFLEDWGQRPGAAVESQPAWERPGVTFLGDAECLTAGSAVCMAQTVIS